MKDKDTLHLFLTYKWYDMIFDNIKREEYRSIDVWKHRIENNDFKCVCFHRGYTNTTMTWVIGGIRRGIGKPEWGAPSHEVYIIELAELKNKIERREHKLGEIFPYCDVLLKVEPSTFFCVGCYFRNKICCTIQFREGCVPETRGDGQDIIFVEQ